MKTLKTTAIGAMQSGSASAPRKRKGAAIIAAILASAGMACIESAWSADFDLANKPESGAGTKEDPFGLADLPKPDNQPTRLLTVLQPGDTLFFNKDEQSWELLPKWRTAGRDGDAVGPENIAPVLDLTRYGPVGRIAGKASRTPKAWWLQPNLRVATYEFLEREHLGRDLSVEEIVSWLDKLGGCDLLLTKGFHYWQGRFDDSTWGYPRFRDKIAALTPRLHREGVKVGVFGFTDRKSSYAGQPDHARIMHVWKGYADMGVDILFVDEESAEGGLNIPATCLEHCDQLRTKFKLPVGIFLYGPASGAGKVREITAHVDVVGEMGYGLFLEARGGYGLAEVTKAWSAAVAGARKEGTAYWTGAMVPEKSKAPGTPFWRERFGARGLGEYFSDYPKAALQYGATGTFFHSLCRLAKLAPDEQAEVIVGMRRTAQRTQRMSGTTAKFRSAKTVFPGRVWAEATPESQGVDAARLKEAVGWLDQNSGPDGAKELVIIRDGYLIWKGPNADASHKIFSCTKVFTSTVLGLLVDDGKCRLDDQAVQHLPSLDDEHSAYSRITLRHLASMSGGYRGIVREVSPDQPWGDPMGYLVPQSPRYESGTACAYHDHDVFLLGQILTRLAREPLKEVFRRRIAEPIGLTRWDWGVVGLLEDGIALNSAAGTPAQNPGIQTTALDLARLGHLYLSRGNWDGKPLLSAAFVDQATTNQVPASRRYASGGDPGGRYGFYWWLNTPQRNGQRAWPAAPPRTYAARGASANACFVVPEWNMVIARLATAPEDSRASDPTWNAFFERLVPAVSTLAPPRLDAAFNLIRPKQ